MEHIFSTRSNQFHQQQLKPIHKLFLTQGVLAYEQLTDRLLSRFCRQLEARFVDGENFGKTCDIGHWISYCEL
jgi:hypothetical protein